MLELPSVTLMCADCVDVARAVNILEKCRSKCNFGAVKFLTSLETDYPFKVPIQPLNCHLDYSVWMLKKAHQYITTPHLLIVQYDGYVLNPEAWDPAWLNYSYIGPLFIHKHTIVPTSVGSGGFSFRSNALMQYVCALLPPWTGSATEYHQRHCKFYEDGMIALHFRENLAAAGFTFAPPQEASKFAQGGNCDPSYYVDRPFGFHGYWPNINRDTGFVDPWP
jgi:hypothetical protein